MTRPRRISTDGVVPGLPRVLLVILDGTLAIVALWGLVLAVTGRDRLGVTLVLALLCVPLLNGAVILAGRLLARRRA